MAAHLFVCKLRLSSSHRFVLSSSRSKHVHEHRAGEIVHATFDNKANILPYLFSLQDFLFLKGSHGTVW